MCSNESRQPHLVLVPYPAQGHVTPFMQLAKLLHSRGFHITFVNTEFNHKRLVRSKGPNSVSGFPDFRFKTIPDGLPPSDYDATQDIPMLCDSTRKNCLVPFKELLAELNSSSSGVPLVTGVISDGIMGFAVRAGEEMGIPVAQFWTASVCAFISYLHHSELRRRGICPFKDEKYLTNGSLDATVDWIPGIKDIRLKDLPSFIRTTDPNDIMFDFMETEARNCFKSAALIFNTLDELERPVLEAVATNFDYHSIYAVGPLPLLTNVIHNPQISSIDSSMWKPDFKCIEWLDRREPESVVYVNFGSITMMTDRNLREFAWGLANSDQFFLWIVRPDVVIDGHTTLPEEFQEETKEKGLVVSWCEQGRVLSHPAVGAFLTHCGWNSMVESVAGGVPVICWPFFADQTTNCRFACTEWGIGMEIDGDVRSTEVAALVREMMTGDKGKKMRQKAQEWKKKADEASRIGGSSNVNFDRLIKEKFQPS